MGEGNLNRDALLPLCDRRIIIIISVVVGKSSMDETNKTHQQAHIIIISGDQWDGWKGSDEEFMKRGRRHNKSYTDDTTAESSKNAGDEWFRTGSDKFSTAPHSPHTQHPHGERGKREGTTQEAEEIIKDGAHHPPQTHGSVRGW